MRSIVEQVVAPIAVGAIFIAGVVWLDKQLAREEAGCTAGPTAVVVDWVHQSTLGQPRLRVRQDGAVRVAACDGNFDCDVLVVGDTVRIDDDGEVCASVALVQPH